MTKYQSIVSYQPTLRRTAQAYKEASVNLTNEQKKELEQYVQKIAEWLRENADPHTRVVIDSERFDVVQDVYGTFVY